jgi:hypothetical protein
MIYFGIRRVKYMGGGLGPGGKKENSSFIVFLILILLLLGDWW